METILSHRTELRRQMRARCEAIPQAVRNEAAAHILKQLQSWPYFDQCERIACYLDDGVEVPTKNIIEAIWRNSQQCYVPCVDPKTDQMKFTLYTPQTKLIKNKLKFLQVEITPNTVFCDPQDLDVVLVPLVGFDDRGDRLGRGGGHYDKAFAFLQRRAPHQYDVEDDTDAIEAEKNFLQKPHLVGLAYANQRIEDFTSQPWDIRLHMVLTG